MRIEQLSSDLGSGDLEADILIVGSGPAGLMVARGLAGSKRDVLVLESGGLQETPAAEELNRVDVASDVWTHCQETQRKTFHKPQAQFWDHDLQGFGIRCRALGGSTAAWAGKSAAFDEMDFEARPWVPMSGWPVRKAELVKNLDRAAEELNLGPNCYNDKLWEQMGRNPPEPKPDTSELGSFFWQFSRSRINPMDVLRSGAEFLANPPEGCRVLTGATALRILTNSAGSKATGVVVSDNAGAQSKIKANTVVLAASAIENPRLLLNSKSPARPKGLGNEHDNVGRYLLDHPTAVIARFEPDAIARMSEDFGFFGVKSAGRTSMYMRGLAPSRNVQESEELLNCAVFMPGERAPDDPWDAAKRLLKRQSKSYSQDACAIFKSPGIVAKGLSRKAFQSAVFPKAMTRFAIDQVIRFRPKLAVEEFLTGGIPHKLVGLPVQAICEQVPDRDNRVKLAAQSDRFGMPLPSVNWRVGEQEKNTLMRLTDIVRNSFTAAGLSPPVAADWVTREDCAMSPIIDMGHTAGTTRMSAQPKNGVVDAMGKVHDCDELYVVGASTFPTIGHANPTLMIMAFADRLAGHLSNRSSMG